MKFTKKILVWFGTGFGLGYSPWAPGTVGTLLGIPLAVWINSQFPNPVTQALITVGLCVAAVPICGAAEKHFQKKDDRHIVADEYLTFPLCMIGLPIHPMLLVVAFLTHRICDIVKPPPARQLQVIKGGLGIVIDDVFSSLYSLGLNWLAWWMMRQAGLI